MTARLWNEGDTLGDLRSVVGALVARLRERAAHRRAPLARTHGPVADAAQSANFQLRMSEAYADRLHDHTVLHDPDRTSSLIACSGECGRVMRFLGEVGSVEWTCSACIAPISTPPVLRLVKGGKDA